MRINRVNICNKTCIWKGGSFAGFGFKNKRKEPDLSDTLYSKPVTEKILHKMLKPPKNKSFRNNYK